MLDISYRIIILPASLLNKSVQCVPNAYTPVRVCVYVCNENIWAQVSLPCALFSVSRGI